MKTHVCIVQILCGPTRHAIYALAIEVTQDELKDPVAMVALADLAREKMLELPFAINPWCGICHSPAKQWQIEIGVTPFHSMAEAQPHLVETQLANARAREAIDALKTKANSN